MYIDVFGQVVRIPDDHIVFGELLVARPRRRLAAFLVKRGGFIRLCAFKRSISGTSSDFRQFLCILKVVAAKRLHMFLTIFESQSDLLSQRVACPREPVAAASKGPGLRMGHFSSGAPLSLRPSSQPPSLPKFNSEIAMPTSVSTTLYCQM